MANVSRFRKLMAIAWRESRTARRRLMLYMSSISLGVAALVAIDSFTANVSQSVRDQSRALLGGDVVLRARDKYSPRATALIDSLSRAGVGAARVTTFASMGLVPRTGATRLLQVKAVAPGYPFYGEIVTRPADVWSRMQTGRYAVVDPAVLVSLDAQIGDTLLLGTARFAILGAIESMPGDVGVSSAIGPRVYIPDAHLQETGLLIFGSRAEYETLLKMPKELSAIRFAARFENRFQNDTPAVRLRTESDNESGITQSIDQFGNFLGVVGLVALLLGGIGVASGVHAFVMRKIDTVAILRCLGATSTQVLWIYVLQATAMGLVGALVGAVFGVIIQFTLPWVLKDFLPVDVHLALVPTAIGLGIGVGVWVATLFALRPLLSLQNVSPLQTLRRESDADVMRNARRPSTNAVVIFAILASILAIALLRAGTIERAVAYAAAIGVAMSVLFGTAALLSWAARRISRPSWTFTVRQGIANLHRPGNQTRAVILSLGFGVFLISTLYQIQSNLLRQLDVRLEKAQANVVFFDIQEDQEPGVSAIIRERGLQVVQRAPIVPMRIAAINDSNVGTILSRQDSVFRRWRDARRSGDRRARLPEQRSPWALRREFRSSYRDEMGAAEKIVEGKWFDPKDTSAQMSIEKDVASELKVKLGDTVTWNVQGVRVPARITSIREVTWARFEPNFFVVFNSSALQGAPKQFAVLANAPTQTEVAQLQRAIVQRYPNVSSIDLSLIQKTIGNVLSKINAAIRFMALVSLAFAIPVLLSAVAATRRERLREGVLLKTLGATKRQVGRIMLVEYALLGVLGSLAGVLLSVGSSYLLMTRVFESAFVPAFVPIVIVGGAMTAIAVAIGVATSRDVFKETPMAALREA